MLALGLPTLKSELANARDVMWRATQAAGVEVVPILEIDAEGVGFVRVCNRVLARGLALGASHIAVLQDDLTTFPAGWAAQMIDAVEQSEDYGMAGPSIRCGTSPQRTGRPGMTGLEVVDLLCYTAVLFKRAMLEDVGLLDESYIHYGGDYDHVRQAQSRGWKAVWARGVYIGHNWESLAHPDWKRHDSPLYYGRWS